MWAQLGEEFPETSFLAFTKRWDIVEDIPFPDNFSIVYSAWPGEAMPPGDRPIAWMDDGTEPRIPSGAFLCEGGRKRGHLQHLSEMLEP